MKITLLGCGNSAGVPMIGCQCAVCTSKNPKNKRMRVSVCIQSLGKTLLIDTSPDLRQQALNANLSRIDGVLYTHDHADHVHGIDDLRSFSYVSGESIDIYSDSKTLEALNKRFPYVFLPKPQSMWFRPSLIPHVLPEGPVASFNVSDISITCFEQKHGKMTTLGYRIGNFAYSTDTDGFSESVFEALAGLDVWVVDCLRYEKHPSHSHLAQTLDWIAQVKPKLAILTHMGHEFDYDVLAGQLPPGVVPGYDGLVVDV